MAAIESARAIRASAPGELVTIRGKVGIATGGFPYLFSGLGMEEMAPPDPDPLFTLTFADGISAQCAFDKTPRADYEAWIRKNQPGTVITVKGIYWGWSNGAFLLTHCEVLPRGFK